jgi:hypothetical protein
MFAALPALIHRVDIAMLVEYDEHNNNSFPVLSPEL